MKKVLDQKEAQALLEIFERRFAENPRRHPDISWEDVRNRLTRQPQKLWSLKAMEDTGGAPDVVVLSENPDSITFVDCAPESPKGRRSLCYDREALDARKKHKPENDAKSAASDMNIRLLSVKEYRKLQELGTFDAKTSSWLRTPADVREKGGAIFGDYRFGRVFIYHNGADSYYGSRGFRGSLGV